MDAGSAAHIYEAWSHGLFSSTHHKRNWWESKKGCPVGQSPGAYPAGPDEDGFNKRLIRTRRAGKRTRGTTPPKFWDRCDVGPLLLNRATQGRL